MTTVNDSCAAHFENYKRGDWDLITDLLGDTVAMLAAGTKWLPKHPKEAQEDYEIRLNASVLYNGFKRTIDESIGRIFERPIIVSDTADEEVVQWMKDVDLTGRDINVFGQSVARDALAYGFTHILIDYPRREDVVTEYDRKQRGLRPFLSHRPAATVFNWQTTNIGGIEMLSRVHLRETAVLPDGEWGEKQVKRVRVYDLVPNGLILNKSGGSNSSVLFRLYEERDGDWVIVGSGALSTQQIPLVTIYAKHSGFMVADPPLNTLARLNLMHWKSYSDYQYYCHKTQVPTLGFFGFNPDEEILVGPNTAIKANSTNARIEYIETTGKGAEVGLKNLESLEARMRAMGAELRIRKPGNTTATQHLIENKESKSMLGILAQELETGLNQAIDIMMQFAKKTTGEENKWITVNKAFDEAFEGDAELAEWGRARERGDLSLRTYLEGLQERGMLSESHDIDLEIAAIEQEKAKAALMNPEPEMNPADDEEDEIPEENFVE